MPPADSGSVSRRHVGALSAERAVRRYRVLLAPRSTPIPPSPTPPSASWCTTPLPPRRSAIAARHIVVPRAGQDGARSVLDLLVLANEGSLARVAADSSAPAGRGPALRAAAASRWERATCRPTPSPGGATPSWCFRRISPGEKQIYARIRDTRRSGRRSIFPRGPGGPINLLLEERSAPRSPAARLALADSQHIEGRLVSPVDRAVARGAVVAGLRRHRTARRGFSLPRWSALLGGCRARAWRPRRGGAPRGAHAARPPAPARRARRAGRALCRARGGGRRRRVGAVPAERARLKAELEARSCGGRVGPVDFGAVHN